MLNLVPSTLRATATEPQIVETRARGLEIPIHD